MVMTVRAFPFPIRVGERGSALRGRSDSHCQIIPVSEADVEHTYNHVSTHRMVPSRPIIRKITVQIPSAPRTSLLGGAPESVRYVKSAAFPLGITHLTLPGGLPAYVRRCVHLQRSRRHPRIDSERAHMDRYVAAATCPGRPEVCMQRQSRQNADKFKFSLVHGGDVGGGRQHSASTPRPQESYRVKSRRRRSPLNGVCTPGCATLRVQVHVPTATAANGAESTR